VKSFSIILFYTKGEFFVNSPFVFSDTPKKEVSHYFETPSSIFSAAVLADSDGYFAVIHQCQLAPEQIGKEGGITRTLGLLLLLF